MLASSVVMGGAAIAALEMPLAAIATMLRAARGRLCLLVMVI